MLKNFKNMMKGVTVALAVLGIGSQAEAGWGHFSGGGSSGGYGGSSGGYGGGSSGGSSGGYMSYYGGSSGGGSSGGWGGSSGGGGGHKHGLLKRLFAHHRAKWGGGSSGGSSGGYGGGSSGGSSGGYTSYYGGSSGGSSGGWGSSGGGVIYAEPAVPSSDPGMSPGDAPLPPREGDVPAGTDSTMIRPGIDSAVLAVRVPADARILVNGRVTATPGAFRQYVSRGLRAGQKYSYEVTAELTVDGAKVVKTENVVLTAGKVVSVAFDFEAKPVVVAPIETKLTLHVPADAKLFLAGREMKATGEVREFSTTKLTAGDQWLTYPVRVVANVDGREVVKEQVISLQAGDAREVAINFESSLAAN